MNIIRYDNPPHAALPITKDQMLQLGFKEEQLGFQSIPGEIKTKGPWQIPVSYSALLLHKQFDRGAVTSVLLFRIGTMRNIRQSGYQLEGRVNLNNKSYRAFSTSQLLNVDGRGLIAAGAIFVCC